MTSVAVAASASAATTDDVLHLLFNQADGILACDQALSATVDAVQDDILVDAAFDVLNDFSQQPEPSPPDSQGSGSASDSAFGSFAGCSSSGASGAGVGSDDLLPFDLDSFLSGAEALGHASYELGPPPEASNHSPGPLRGGVTGGIGSGAGGSVSGGKRRKRQLAQLPYSIGDLEDDDLALYGGGGVTWDDGDDDDGSGLGGGQIEGRPGEPLLLTAEEQRVARQLGAVLPSHFPLTREEMRVLRTVRRKIRNKISAKNSRAKKQEYVRGLELRVKGSAVENAALRDRCAGLEQQNRRLLGAVRRLQAFLRCSGLSLTSTAGKATGTGLFILCLSFALFLTPQLGPLLAAGPGAGDPATAAARPATGRRILAASPEEASLTAAGAAEKPAVDFSAAGPIAKQVVSADSPTSAANSSIIAVESAIAADADSVASPSPPSSPSLSPSSPSSPSPSSSSPSSPSPSYYYYGDEDAPPREQDLADRDL